MIPSHWIAAMTLLFCLGTARAATAAAPVIFYTDIVAGPNTGGENNNGAYLSIFGKNFGSDIGAVTVTVGGGLAARKMFLGPAYGRPDVQWLAVQLGPAAQSGPIVVSVAGTSSNADKTFTVRPGNFYFISLAGNNATGAVNDIARPYRTPNYVMGLASIAAGDFIVIRGALYDLSSGNEGLYNNRWLNVGVGSGSTIKSGTSNTNAITVYGYPGENAVIDFGTLTTNAVVGIRAYQPVSYYTFANIVFDLKDSYGEAIFLGFYTSANSYCDDCRLVNLKVQGGMAAPGSGGGSTVRFNLATGIKAYGLNVGNQSSNTPADSSAHMISELLT